MFEKKKSEKPEAKHPTETESLKHSQSATEGLAKTAEVVPGTAQSKAPGEDFGHFSESLTRGSAESQKSEERFGSPATGASEKPAGNVPPQAGQENLGAVPTVDQSVLDKQSVLDRLVAHEQSLMTPEIIKTKLAAADAAREHGRRGAGDLHGDSQNEEKRDGGANREADPDRADEREVTIKLGSSQEGEYVHEGDVVTHVNRGSGEITLRVGKGSPSFKSVRAREIVRGTGHVATSGTGAISSDPPLNADGTRKHA